MKILATKAQRHQGSILNKTFCVTLCPRAFVANFIEISHDTAPAQGNE